MSLIASYNLSGGTNAKAERGKNEKTVTCQKYSSELVFTFEIIEPLVAGKVGLICFSQTFVLYVSPK